MVDLDKLEERRRLASDLASELGDAGFISWMTEAYEAAEAISDAQAALTSAKAEIERLKEGLRPFKDAHHAIQREGVTIRDVIGPSDLRRAAAAMGEE